MKEYPEPRLARSHVQSAPQEAPSGTSPKWVQGSPAERFLLLFLSIAAVVLLLLSLDFRAGRDQAIFLEGGRVILEGGALYRDVWDIKPPGLFVLYALAIQMFGMSDIAPRLLELIFFGVTSACIIGLSAMVLNWRAGLFAVFLLAVGLTKSGFQYMAQAETLSFPFICLAILLLSRSPASRRAETWTWIVAGALYGCAFLMKPTLAVGAIVGFLLVAMAVWRRDGARAVWRPALCFAAGGSGMLCAAVVYLTWSGGFWSFVEISRDFTAVYTSAAHEQASLPRLFARGGFILGEIALTASAGAALLLLLMRSAPGVAGPALHLALLAAAMLFTVALQGKFIPYHFHAPLLPVAILGGWGFWLLWRRVATNPVAITGFAALLALLLVTEQGTAEIRRMVTDRVAAWQAPEPLDVRGSIRWDESRNAEAARWIDRTAPPNARGLFVWGFEPQIYLNSRLETANRYVINTVLRMDAAPEVERQRLMRSLRHAPPWAIVVQDDDVILHMYGNRLTSREVLERDFPELKTFIARHYKLTKTLGGLTIHVRSDDGTGSGQDALSLQEPRRGW